MQVKICPGCNVQKLHSDFFKDKKTKDGIRVYCKICSGIKSRAWALKKPERMHALHIKDTYGLSAERYEQMLKEQNNKCKICGSPDEPLIKRKRLQVDHCHLTNKIRGLLCSPCNIAIGRLKDDINLLKSAIEYLQFYQK